MGTELMRQVMEHSRHRGSALITMLVLAEAANEEARVSLSIAYIAERARLQVRNIRYILNELESSGELVIDPGSGPNGQNTYYLRCTGEQSSTPVLHVLPEPEQDADDTPPRQAASSGTGLQLPEGTDLDTPWGIYSMLCLTYKRNPAKHRSARPEAAAQQMKIAKNLLDKGWSGDEITRCLWYLRSESWRKHPADMRTVASEIHVWDMAGQPEREQNGRLDANEIMRRAADLDADERRQG